MDERNEQLKTVSNWLVWSLAALVAVGVLGAFLVYLHNKSAPATVSVPTPVAVLFVGFVGGFVGLQRRLKTLPPEDLTLLANSWVCIALSPIAGAILAVLVYLLFCSGLLAGNLFPAFLPDDPKTPIHGLQDMFAVHCTSGADYPRSCSGASSPDFLKSSLRISWASLNQRQQKPL